jgi:hypothetical protein
MNQTLNEPIPTYIVQWISNTMNQQQQKQNDN